MKNCSFCKQQKSFSEFHKSGNGYQGTCKPCTTLRRRIYRKKNTKKVLNNWYSWKYKVSYEFVQELLASQDNCCAICKIKLLTTKNTCLDHCHTTNKIRGVLCQKCNQGIAKFNDSIQVLTKAIEYLSHNETKV
jgi:hypothetical protein